MGRVRGGAALIFVPVAPAAARRGALKLSRAGADSFEVSDEHSPLSYLSPAERRLLGPLVGRLCATDNPRFERAVETTGAKATVRMACVNALRLYAIVLFVLGLLGRLAHVAPIAYVFFALAAACMAWSFWCLYTVVGPEREFKRLHAGGPRSL
jgi:hypothetical protein